MIRPVEGRNNNFDFLRLLAALLVVFFHSYMVAGQEDMVKFGYLGVSAFFVISGYLVTQSWHNDPNAYRFLWKRSLRIIPGLIGVAVFTIMVIGPLNTTLSLKDYFTSVSTWAYMSIASVFYMVWSLPGVFASNTVPFFINASLWTIPVEFKMYVILALFGMLGLIYKRKFMLALLFLSALIYANSRRPDVLLLHHFADLAYNVGIAGFIEPLILLDPVSYPTLFLIGSLYYLYREKIDLYPWLGVGGVIACALMPNMTIFYLLLFTVFPYCVLSIAFTPSGILQNAGKYGDLSYGVYIYAFPIQQTVVAYFPGIGPMGVFFFATPLIITAAFLSWHIIESKALALKRFDPVQWAGRSISQYAGKSDISVKIMPPLKTIKK